MFVKAKFEEATYLTLGVGAINVAFTIVAVSVYNIICRTQCDWDTD